MLTDEQMKAELRGVKPAAKVQMILLGGANGRLYRRVDGGWELYPED